MPGNVAIVSASPSEASMFDMKRPMRCVAFEPDYSKRNTKQFVCGGMAGNLILHEKGWLGAKETILHSGEGPIWATRWHDSFIAWANDEGVRIYDTRSSQRIALITRPENSPRADLYKCSLYWQDNNTLLIAWADYIKVAVIKEREKQRHLAGVPGVGSATQVYVEISAIFQVDCMISGITPFQQSYIIIAYPAEDAYTNEMTNDPDQQKRREGQRPEMRVISADGEELSSDVLSFHDYARYQSGDYAIAPAPSEDIFYVISPKDIIVVKPRDEADHIAWLIERKQYAEALRAVESSGMKGLGNFDVVEIGTKYLQHLVEEGQLFHSEST